MSIKHYRVWIRDLYFINYFINSFMKPVTTPVVNGMSGGAGFIIKDCCGSRQNSLRLTPPRPITALSYSILSLWLSKCLCIYV